MNQSISGESPQNQTIWEDLIHNKALCQHVVKRGQKNLEEKFNGGKTPLIYACCVGKVEIVKILLQQGADVNAADIKGKTALHYACDNGSVEIVEELLVSSEDINVDTKENQLQITPLHCACIRGNLPIVQLLIQHQADVDAMDCNGQTALSHVKSDAVAEELINNGADVSGYMYDNNSWNLTDVLIVTRFSKLLLQDDGYQRDILNDLNYRVVHLQRDNQILSEAFEDAMFDLTAKEYEIETLRNQVDTLKELKEANRVNPDEVLENVPQNAPSHLMKQRSIIVQLLQQFNLDVQSSLCPICQVNAKQFSGNCGHRYCNECINRCQKDHGQCYQCKQDIGTIRKIFD